MKLYVWLLFLVAMLISACNHEGPIDATKYDSNNEVQWTIEDYQQNPSTKIYHLYMPSKWCPAMASSPWIDYWLGGNKYPHELTYDQVHNRQNDIYKNYYRQDIWANYEDEVIVFIKYGNYRCQCESPTQQAEICSTSVFAVEYDVTNDKSQKEWVLAFRLYRGQVTAIDRNLILPLRADIITSPIVLNEEASFWLDRVQYTAAVGISNANIKWEFPDGTTRWGWNFKHIPQAHGSIRVTITDNLGKFLKLYKDI